MSKQRTSGTGPAILALTLSIGLGTVARGQDAAPQLSWDQGPGVMAIGDALAEIEISDSYVFLDGERTQTLLDLTENPTSGSELATLAPAEESAGWFVIFEWDEIGYVPDTERDELDPKGLLESIQTGTAASNEERKKKGWSTMEIVGWHEEPHYDAKTNNLSWAIIGESEGNRVVNRTVKLLGRRGVMTATLVSSPEELTSAIARVDGALEGYRFRPGNTYAEYAAGHDKLAEYGLGALIVGGAGAALVKSGFLAKFWKWIVALGIAGAAGARRLFGRAGRQSQPQV